MHSLSILVADVSDRPRSEIVAALRARGHRVSATPDVRSAIHAIRANTFDVILSEVLMGEDDGLEIIKAARHLQPSARVVAMSGGGEFLSSSYCLRLAAAYGAQGRLPRPFAAEDLVSAVEGVAAAGR